MPRTSERTSTTTKTATTETMARGARDDKKQTESDAWTTVTRNKGRKTREETKVAPPTDTAETRTIDNKGHGHGTNRNARRRARKKAARAMETAGAATDATTATNTPSPASTSTKPEICPLCHAAITEGTIENHTRKCRALYRIRVDVSTAAAQRMATAGATKTTTTNDTGPMPHADEFPALGSKPTYTPPNPKSAWKHRSHTHLTKPSEPIPRGDMPPVGDIVTCSLCKKMVWRAEYYHHKTTCIGCIVKCRECGEGVFKRSFREHNKVCRTANRTVSAYVAHELDRAAASAGAGSA